MTNRNEMYLVTCNHCRGSYAPERDVSRLTRESTIEDIMCGQFEDIAKILAFDPVSGTARDATKEIADAVAERCDRNLDAPSFMIFAFIENNGANVLRSLRAA